MENKINCLYKNLIHHICKFLDFKDVFNFCQTNRYLHSKVESYIDTTYYYKIKFYDFKNNLNVKKIFVDTRGHNLIKNNMMINLDNIKEIYFACYLYHSEVKFIIEKCCNLEKIIICKNYNYNEKINCSNDKIKVIEIIGCEENKNNNKTNHVSGLMSLIAYGKSDEYLMKICSSKKVKKHFKCNGYNKYFGHNQYYNKYFKNNKYL